MCWRRGWNKLLPWTQSKHELKMKKVRRGAAAAAADEDLKRRSSAALNRRRSLCLWRWHQRAAFFKVAPLIHISATTHAEDFIWHISLSQQKIPPARDEIFWNTNRKLPCLWSSWELQQGGSEETFQKKTVKTTFGQGWESTASLQLFMIFEWRYKLKWSPVKHLKIKLWCPQTWVLTVVIKTSQSKKL